MESNKLTRRFIVVVAVVFLIFFSVFVWKTSEKIETTTYQVNRVLDGDTIILNNDEIVRYLGIDAPENKEKWGEEAKKLNENLVLGRKIKLEFDKESGLYDSYQRLLAYIWLGDVLVNERLIEEGLAKVSVLPGSSLRHIKRLYTAQKKAKEARKGIWVEK